MASTAPYGTRNPVHGHIGEDVDGSERHRQWRDAQVPNIVPDDLDEAGDDGYWLMSDPSHRRPHRADDHERPYGGPPTILSNLMIGKIMRTGEAEMYHFQMDGEYFLGADHGRLVDLGGLGVRFKIYSEQTGGNFAVVEHPIEPGVIVEPHTHQHEDELSYVVSGTIWARVGDKEIQAPAGTYIWKPRQVMHTFWNPGPEPALIVETISPGGFERLFEQVAALLEDQEPGPSTDQDVIVLCNQYGLALDRTWLPELQARFGPMRMV